MVRHACKGLVLRCSLGLLGILSSAAAQGTRSDYERAQALPRTYAEHMSPAMPKVHWLENDGGLWWKQGAEFVKVDAQGVVSRLSAEPASLEPATASAPKRERRKESRTAPDRAWRLELEQTGAVRRQVRMIESRPKDRLEPKLFEHEYAKPGDEIGQWVPRLVNLQDQSTVRVDPEPFRDAWSVGQVHWAADSSEVYVLYNQRGHQLQRLYAIEARTGAVRIVLEERSPTFIDYSQKTWLHWLEQESACLWASERSGRNHIYRVDLRSGELRAVTQGDYIVRQVERVDEEQGFLECTVYGLYADQDPYYAHLARIRFTGELQALTHEDGTHEWSFSPNRSLLVDRYSRVDQPPVVKLKRARDGAELAVLWQQDASKLAAKGWRPPERFVAAGRDGQTPIHGIVILPSNFDPERSYPVVEDIYAGPHDFHVPKDWGAGIRQRMIAELGFVVVQIDGMGTNWRHKAFHDVAWRNLKDSGFPDRIAWLRALAQQRPYLDLRRVGIFGGSAGGQSALAALLHHSDFYSVAVSDCGCHDNRMDKIWWNEAWMGYPIGPWYADSSNATHAHRLQGKLLLTVGELDTNVDPASTLQVVGALIEADKDFDLVVVPGAGHGVGESPYLVRRRQDFFVRHLLGVEPRR